MATKLKDLKITKVDFVDKGANPKANIMLYKNESGKPGGEPSHEEHPKHENVLKRFVAVSYTHLDVYKRQVFVPNRRF